MWRAHAEGADGAENFNAESSEAAAELRGVKLPISFTSEADRITSRGPFTSRLIPSFMVRAPKFSNKPTGHSLSLK